MDEYLEYPNRRYVVVYRLNAGGEVRDPTRYKHMPDAIEAAHRNAPSECTFTIDIIELKEKEKC